MAERDTKIADEHASGATFTELADRYGISRQRCHQIDEAVKKSRERSKDSLYASVARAACVVNTKQAARAYNMILKHGMDECVPTWEEISSTYNVGIVTAAVIAVTLGVPIPSDVVDELRLRGYMGNYVDKKDES